MMVNSNDSDDKSPSSGMREYKCEVKGCCYRTNRAYNLWRHERRHSEESERKLHQCVVCLYSTNKATNLKRHIGTRHPQYNLEEATKGNIVNKSQLTRCDFPGCKYITNRPYDMRRHLSVHCHQEKDQKKFKCSLCLYSSDRKANLHRHVEVRHAWRRLSLSLQGIKKGEVKDYEGEEEEDEELEYHTLDDLIEEVELTLSEQEPEPEPEAQIKEIEYIIKQESVDSKDLNYKKFKCNVCGYSSDRKSNLHRHFQVRHAFQRLNRSLIEMKKSQSPKKDEGEEELEYQTLDDLIEVEVIQSEPEPETEPQNEELVEVNFVDIEPVKVPEAQPKIKPVIKANTSTVWQLPQLEGNSKDKQVIAINVNGEMRWFQSIQPPEGASSELQRAMQMQGQEPQIVQQITDNYLHNEYEEYEVLSLNRAEEEEEFEEEFVDEYDQEETESEHHVYNIEMVDERQETHAPQALTHSTPLQTRAKQESFVLTKKNANPNDWTWTTSNVSSPDPETYTINTYLTS
ncbi:RE1-silencing transcription factor isoform X2 [Drosophila tropicalis]|uniref:RE1-silencing transcription factor isoform X2 n=1 Tax=Drosophila tropicalis TaxID=46794 RepID=UPI0035ABA4B6